MCSLDFLVYVYWAISSTFFVELFKYNAEKQLSLMVIFVVSVFAGSKHIKSGTYYSKVGYQTG